MVTHLASYTYIGLDAHTSFLQKVLQVQLMDTLNSGHQATYAIADTAGVFFSKHYIIIRSIVAMVQASYYTRASGKPL